MKLSALNPFRFRALLPGVLALGLLLGIWLGDLFKGFGWGPGHGGGPSTGGPSTGGPNAKATGETADDAANRAGIRGTSRSERTGLEDEPDTEAPSRNDLVRVLIDGRDYFILHGKKREPIGLDKLVELIKQTEPNEDGIKAVINRTVDSRPSAENQLKTSLENAGIPKSAVDQPERAVE